MSSRKAKPVPSATTVCKSAPISTGTNAIPSLSVRRRRAHVSVGDVERTSIHLDSLLEGHSRTSAPRVSSVQMRAVGVRPCCRLAALASSIGMVSSQTLSSWTTRLIASIDQCEPPPNFAELADTTGRGLNVNGSVCLNNVCMCVVCWSLMSTQA